MPIVLANGTISPSETNCPQKIPSGPHTVAEIMQFVALDEGTGRLFWLPRRGNKAWNVKHAGREVGGGVSDKGYHHFHVDGKNYRTHRVVWAISHGAWPTKFVDHINGDRSDNRPCNLREADGFQNRFNRGALDGKAEPVGVTRVASGRYVARIQHKGRVHHIGTFDCPNEAYRARCALAEKKHGDFAYHLGAGK